MATSPEPTEHPLLTRLARIFVLSEAEAAAIAAVSFQSTPVRADHPISREGDVAFRSCLVSQGLACTSKLAAGGARQIMAFHIRGDMPDLHSLHLHVHDSDIRAITDCRLAYMPHADLRRLGREHPRLTEELWRITLVDAAIYREWMVNVSRRPALSRVAHLFCEMMLRMEVEGLAQDDTCALPITQANLSEATGLSQVYVNRTLQELRAQDLIAFGQGVLTIRDRPALVELGDFQPDYLHLRPHAPAP